MLISRENIKNAKARVIEAMKVFEQSFFKVSKNV